MDEQIYKINDRIFEMMKENHLTIEQFSKRIHVCTRSIYNWKNKKQLPSLDGFIAICLALNISADWLLFGINKNDLLTKE